VLVITLCEFLCNKELCGLWPQLIVMTSRDSSGGLVDICSEGALAIKVRACKVGVQCSSIIDMQMLPGQ
jgi:hypothetical protein